MTTTKKAAAKKAAAKPRTCKARGCNEPVHAKGLCPVHYRAARTKQRHAKDA